MYKISAKLLQLPRPSFYSYWTKMDTLNSNLKIAQYAVRGLVPISAARIQNEIDKMKALGQKNSYPFDSITELNIGNPQIFGQKPLTFNRQVLACMISKDAANSPSISQDAKNRANLWQSKIGYSIGAYSPSLGFPFIREIVAEFIQKRDGSKNKPKYENIMMCAGASEGISLIMDCLISSPNDGVMIPIPQYPLYSAAISLKNAQAIGYYLDEQKGWTVSLEELEKQYQESILKGINPKIIVVINPGNPTGQIIDENTLQDIIKFSFDHKIIIFSDEVYQDNIYAKNKTFVSMRKVMENMPAPYNSTELFSFHSISKGITGECGFRGGYVEISEMDPEVMAQFVKAKSIVLCPNNIGQIMTALMVQPPSKEEGCSDQTIESHKKEQKDIFESLKRRSRIVTESLNSIKGINTQEVEGAMYAFPSVQLPQKFIDESISKGYDEPDLYYCVQALEQTGMVFVPGSGFYQKPGSYHFRTTTLILPEDELKAKFDLFKKWHENLFKSE